MRACYSRMTPYAKGFISRRASPSGLRSGRDRLGLTTPFTTQNRPRVAYDLFGLRSPIRKIASTSKDIWSSEGSGGDARRTSYTLSPSQNAPST
jgi:hypothetical protein